MKMKKFCTLGLIVVMLFSLNIAVLGSTIGVNVSEGASVSVEKTDFDKDSYKIIGNFGVSDHLLVWLGYNTKSEDDNVEATPRLGIRYELAKNFAGIFEYRTNDSGDEMDFGFRAKAILSKHLALVGEAKYINLIPEVGDSYSGYSVLAQAEYALTPLITANFGVQSTDYDQSGIEGATSFLVGAELYPTEQLSWWVDYSYDQDSKDDIIGAGIEYKF
jgi:predicted porin